MKPGYPSIRKADSIRGARLRFRNVTIDDAEFVLSLRIDENKSRYLSKTPEDVGIQREWIRSYAVSDDQAYFIIEHEGRSIGTVRIYDARETSFCLGSLILMDGGSRGATVEALGIILSYAIDELGFETCYFHVRKANERVWRFYERFGVQRTAETADDYHYTYSLEAIRDTLERYRTYLPSGIVVSRIGALDRHHPNGPLVVQD